MKSKLIGLVLLAIVVPSGLYYTGNLPFLESTDDAVELDGGVELVPTYLALDPPFVVNFMHRGTLRYLQLSLEIMYHDEAILAKISERMPAIRNDLILLFSNQEFEKLSTLSGKEELRLEIMLAVNDILGIDSNNLNGEQKGEVYITNFVMQ